MSNSNYPAGVSDSHAYFNPPAISASAVECFADEALVIPSYTIKGALFVLQDRLDALSASGWAVSNKDARAIVHELAKLQERITELEQEHEYECPFNDEIDLEESECARWVCPVCGNDRETDTLPEERDPDEEWERRNER